MKPKTIKCKIKTVVGNEKSCNAFSKNNYACTRLNGHKGKHHAHGLKNKDGTNECFDRWDSK